MENETPQATQAKSNMMPIAIVVAIVVIILVGVIAFAMNSNKSSQQATDQQAVPTQATGDAMEAQPTTGDAMMSAYKDGKYEATGEYTSPGGTESIDVTLTLKGGIVIEADVVSKATRPTSKQMQVSFISGYKEQVVGKKIDEINLTKVAASSLAPKGFNDAVEKIKTEAQS